MAGAVSARAYGKLKFDVPVFLLSIRKKTRAVLQAQLS